MVNKIAGCVILYNPKIADLENIKTYTNKVDKLYVFDNTEKKSNEKFFENFKNVIYFWDSENKGIAIRLNQACQTAIQDGFEFLLTMDQDSSFDEKNLNLYFESIYNFQEKDNVAVFGIEYNKNDLKKEAPFFEDVDHVITSAAIMNLNLYQQIGGFDENLFIDGVDIDYCYAASVQGYKCKKFTNIFFEHSLGEDFYRGSLTTLYLFKKKIKLHTGTRIYYMHRNMLYLEKKYKKILPDKIKKLIKTQNYHLKKNIKYSKNIIKILKFYFKAKSDFKNGKMGKYV